MKPEPPRPGAADAACPTCEGALLGPFCHRCGEQRPDPRRDRLIEYALAPVRAVGSLDGRWLRAVWSLVRRPGELSAEWARGARVRWPRPWSVFFFVNVTYYLVAAYISTGFLKTPLQMHLSGSPWRKDVAARLLQRGYAPDDIERLAGLGEGRPSAALSQFARAYDAHAASVSKLAVVSLVPMFAALLAVAFLRSGRRVVDHLVLATHFIAWWIGFAVLAVLPLFEGLGAAARGALPGLEWLKGDAVFVPVELGLATLWLGLAARRFYGAEGAAWRWARALGLSFGLLGLIVGPFRRLEFLFAWWTL